MTHRDDTTPEPDAERDVLGWLPELHAEDVERAGHAAEVEYAASMEAARRDRVPTVAALLAAAMILALLLAVLVAS